MGLLAASALAVIFAGGAAAEPSPTGVLAANRAAAHGEALAGKGSLRLVYAYAGEGMSGEVTSTYDLATGAFVDTAHIGPVTGANGFDGRTAWMRDMSGAVTPEAGGDKRELAVNEAYRDANLWWKPGFGGARIASLGVRNDDGHAYDVLSVNPDGGKPFEAWFDAGTHLLARTVERQGFQTITTFYSDYAPKDGFLIAASQSIDDGAGAQYRQSQRLTSASFVPASPAGAYGPPRWSVSDATIANAAGRTTVPFRLLNNHIYAEVRVNGKGPFLCIFDTGGHDIITPETAKALTVRSEGEAPGTGAGEGVVNVGFAKNVTFQIGDLVLHDKAITVLPFEEDSIEGFDEQGMIGFEVFRRFVTIVDYGAGALTFIDPAKFDPHGAGTPVLFVFYDHLPQVRGTIDGLPGQFDIDTGSRSELDLTKPFVAAQGLMAKHPDGVLAVSGWGVGGPARSYVTRARRLTLGPVKIDHLVVGLATQDKGAFADPNYIGNVGSGLLKRFVVTFDYANRITYLKPRSAPVPDTDVFDKSGMWINAVPGGFKIVDVTAKGGAEAAGLKVGNVITAVDGAPASTIALSDFRQRLRDGVAGTRVELSIAGRADPVSIILEDQI